MTPPRPAGPRTEETLRSARALCEAGDFKAAIGVLECALGATGSNPRLRRLLAIAALGAGDVARALVLLEALALERPVVESATVDLAVALLVSGRTDAARVILERVTRDLPASTRAWSCLGVAYERLGRIAAADVAFARGNCTNADRRAHARQEATRLASSDEG